MEKHFHVLEAGQFSKEDVVSLCTLATRIRRIAKKKEGLDFLRGLLPHKRVMLYFTQPSTRTFLSFYTACQILGISLADVRDTRTSSEMKGETQEDSIRTFSSYFDMIIMRTPDKALPRNVANMFSKTGRPVPIINGGSGSDEHPTQALLDIYTLERSFENYAGIEHKNIVFCGDLKRSRTVRSLVQLLSRYRGVQYYFVAPKQLQIDSELLKSVNILQYNTSDKLEDSIVEGADAIYVTRIQDEWDHTKGESMRYGYYSIGPYVLSLMKPSAIIMHPLPRRDEISTVVDNDPRAMYWRQVRNGMWIRTALIASIFGVDKTIEAYTWRSK